jgi:uncharacterized membrane protein YdbT with pleckstrin-like domain
MLVILEAEIMSDEITLRPSVTKTFAKAGIAIVVFSMFLNVNPSKLLNFAIFIAVSLLMVLAYASLKKANKYTLTEKGIIVRSFLRAEKVINYSDISDLSISQGILAKKFDCGTIFINIRSKPAPYAVLGGGMAEALRDVKHPSKIFETISSHLQPF